MAAILNNLHILRNTQGFTSGTRRIWNQHLDIDKKPSNKFVMSKNKLCSSAHRSHSRVNSLVDRVQITKQSMASHHIGNVPKLGDGYTFDEWLELLEAWFDANGIQDDGNKRAIFLTNLGSKSYHTLHALLQPEKPTEKTYGECKKALAEHFAPKPTEIFQRYRFYTLVQKKDETIPEFVAKLRQLSDGCKFKELDNMLRDRLVVGCRDTTIQRKLLSESELTFEKALNIARAMEIADKDVENLRSIGKLSDAETPDELHKIRLQKPKTSQKQNPGSTQAEVNAKKRCWRCGSANHTPPSCPFSKEKCFKCSQLGHTKSQCDRVQAYRKKHFGQRAQKGAHHLEAEDHSLMRKC